jgi:hypothetical protein
VLYEFDVGLETSWKVLLSFLILIPVDPSRLGWVLLVFRVLPGLALQSVSVDHMFLAGVLCKSLTYVLSLSESLPKLHGELLKCTLEVSGGISGRTWVTRLIFTGFLSTSIAREAFLHSIDRNGILPEFGESLFGLEGRFGA